jgi:ribosomal protein S18 acetylase RimI-like enzyme
MHISVVHADEFAPLREELIELLQDAVDSGASVGFLPPLDRDEAAGYWQSVEMAVRHHEVLLLAARDEHGVLGSVQLMLPDKPNARHRAEVRKLLVNRRARRRGVGRSLMQAVEVQSAALGRTMLVLDTRKGDAAEKLYVHMGYHRAGEIPRYARSANGELHTTVFFWRELGG